MVKTKGSFKEGFKVMHRERLLAVIVAVLVIPLVAIPIYYGWIGNVSELATQIVSGMVVGMVIAAVALWYRGGSRSDSKQTIQVEVKYPEPTKTVLDYRGRALWDDFEIVRVK